MLPLLLFACSGGSKIERVEPSFVVVELEGDLGTEEAPLPFSADPVTWIANVTTLDKNGDPYPFNGDLKINVRPGRLDMDPWETFTDGEWSGEVTFHAAFGPTRIWFTDEGDKDIDSGRVASWAAGVSDPIRYAFPTITEMNRHEDTETNHLEKEFAEIRAEDRQIVVTVVGADGFWVTDLAALSEEGAPAGNYASLFVYSFSKPDGVVAGSHLTKLNGNNQEYLGSTQISFPTYTVAEDVTLPVPAPVVVTEEILCDPAAMEALEAAVIELEGAEIPADFGPGSDDYEDYVTYGQWPVQVGKCTVYIDSSGADTGVDPLSSAGDGLSTARGIVSQIWDQWVLVVTENDDLQVGSAAPRPSAAAPPRKEPAPRRPKPRHRSGAPANDEGTATGKPHAHP